MTISTPATLRVRNELAPYIEKLINEDAHQTVLVGVSGGADSLCLASALFTLKKTLNVIPIVIDHNLQKNSDAIARDANYKLEKIGYQSIFIAKADVVLVDGIEASARRARYKIFNQALDNFSSRYIFLGHTKNDQAETVLMGLTRGSSSRSIEGMRFSNPPFLRPLLNVSRSETVQYCQENKIEYWNDVHNFDNRFTRVRIRKNIIPMIEQELGNGVINNLANSAFQFQRDNDYLNLVRDEFIEQLNQSNLKWRAGNLSKSVDSFKQWSCELDLLVQHHPAIRSRALREIFLHNGVNSEPLNSGHFDAIEKLLLSGPAHGPVYLPGGIWARVAENRFILEVSDRQ